MVELINDLPPTVAAFRVTGKVTKEEYETLIIPAVDKVAKTYGKINFLLVLDTDVANYSAGAWIDDMWLGLKHLTQWRKIGIVSSQSAVKKITDIFGNIISHEARGFLPGQLEEAKQWIAA